MNFLQKFPVLQISGISRQLLKTLTSVCSSSGLETPSPSFSTSLYHFTEACRSRSLPPLPSRAPQHPPLTKRAISPDLQQTLLKVDLMDTCRPFAPKVDHQRNLLHRTYTTMTPSTPLKISFPTSLKHRPFSIKRLKKKFQSLFTKKKPAELQPNPNMKMRIVPTGGARSSLVCEPVSLEENQQRLTPKKAESSSKPKQPLCPRTRPPKRPPKNCAPCKSDAEVVCPQPPSTCDPMSLPYYFKKVCVKTQDGKCVKYEMQRVPLDFSKKDASHPTVTIKDLCGGAQGKCKPFQEPKGCDKEPTAMVCPSKPRKGTPKICQVEPRITIMDLCNAIKPNPCPPKRENTSPPCPQKNPCEEPCPQPKTNPCPCPKVCPEPDPCANLPDPCPKPCPSKKKKKPDLDGMEKPPCKRPGDAPCKPKPPAFVCPKKPKVKCCPKFVYRCPADACKPKRKDPCKKKPVPKICQESAKDPCKANPCPKKEDPCKRKSPPKICEEKTDEAGGGSGAQTLLCKKKDEDPCKKTPKPTTCGGKNKKPSRKKGDCDTKPMSSRKKNKDLCMAKYKPWKKKDDPCAKIKKRKAKTDDPCPKPKVDPCPKEDPCKTKSEPCPQPKADPCKEEKPKDPCNAQPDPCAKFQKTPRATEERCKKKPPPKICQSKAQSDPCLKKPIICEQKKQDPCLCPPKDPCAAKPCLECNKSNMPNISNHVDKPLPPVGAPRGKPNPKPKPKKPQICDPCTNKLQPQQKPCRPKSNCAPPTKCADDPCEKPDYPQVKINSCACKKIPFKPNCSPEPPDPCKAKPLGVDGTTKRKLSCWTRCRSTVSAPALIRRSISYKPDAPIWRRPWSQIQPQPGKFDYIIRYVPITTEHKDPGTKIIEQREPGGSNLIRVEEPGGSTKNSMMDKRRPAQGGPGCTKGPCPCNPVPQEVDQPCAKVPVESCRKKECPKVVKVSGGPRAAAPLAAKPKACPIPDPCCPRVPLGSCKPRAGVSCSSPNQCKLKPECPCPSKTPCAQKTTGGEKCMPPLPPGGCATCSKYQAYVHKPHIINKPIRCTAKKCSKKVTCPASALSDCKPRNRCKPLKPRLLCCQPCEKPKLRLNEPKAKEEIPYRESCGVKAQCAQGPCRKQAKPAKCIRIKPLPPPAKPPEDKCKSTVRIKKSTPKPPTKAKEKPKPKTRGKIDHSKHTEWAAVPIKGKERILPQNLKIVTRAKNQRSTSNECQPASKKAASKKSRPVVQNQKGLFETCSEVCRQAVEQRRKLGKMRKSPKLTKQLPKADPISKGLAAGAKGLFKSICRGIRPGKKRGVCTAASCPFFKETPQATPAPIKFVDGELQEHQTKTSKSDTELIRKNLPPAEESQGPQEQPSTTKKNRTIVYKCNHKSKWRSVSTPNKIPKHFSP